MSGANVFIFVPAYRHSVSTTTFGTCVALVSEMLNRGIGVAVGHHSWHDIAELRNMVLSVWYDGMPNSTHILFIDDDIGFPANLLFDMLAFNEPVVGGLYRKKSLDWNWAASALPKDKPGEFRGRAFLEVEGIGAGALLIRRDAITKMIEQYPELVKPYMTLVQFRSAGIKRTISLFDQMASDEGKVAEDISFCRRWRACGGKVWASTGYEITHIGAHEFVGCYARRKMEEDAEAAMKAKAAQEADNGQSAA